MQKLKIFIALACLAAPAHASDEWIDGFYGNGMNTTVTCLTEYQGNLVAGGYFSVAGNVPANQIAVFDGLAWATFSTGFNGQVYAVATWGNLLLAAGSFTSAGGTPVSNLAAWNGSSWMSFAGGANGPIYAIEVHEDELWIGGVFNEVGGGVLDVENVAIFDSTSWFDPGSVNGPVYALESWGGEVFVGGAFSSAGGLSAQNIARYLGGWGLVNGGTSATVRTIVGGETGLFVGGDFLFVDNNLINSNYIAVWDGNSWDNMGSGVSGPVKAIGFYEGVPHIGGSFTSADGQPVLRVAQWDGNAAWIEMEGGLNGECLALQGHDSALFCGGSFTTSGIKAALRIAKWDGTGWNDFPGMGMDNFIWDMTMYHERPVAGGRFLTAGQTLATHIAVWQGFGVGWQAFGTGLPTPVTAVTVYNDSLVAADSLGIHEWTEVDWNEVGDICTECGDRVNDMVVYDGKLIAGGVLSSINLAPMNNLASFNGEAWQQVAVTDGPVHALAVWNGLLVVGGDFNHPIPNLFALDDQFNLVNLGAFSGKVLSLLNHQTYLYAGGDFNDAGAVPAQRVARYKVEWESLGEGFDGGVTALGGDHSGLVVAGGDFGFSGLTETKRLAYWTGGDWQELGGGMNDRTHGLVANLDTTFYGGEFTVAGVQASLFVAGRTLQPLAVPDVSPVQRLLSGAHPNPSRGAAHLFLTLPEPSLGKIQVFDVTGRLVRTLEDGLIEAGQWRVTWDGQDRSGGRVAPGVYFVRSTYGGSAETRKLVRVR